MSVKMLVALAFVLSLPVFVSAGAANSGGSAMDPDVDIWRVTYLNPTSVYG